MDRGAWWATVHGVTKSQTWVMEYYLAITKNEIGSFSVMWMNLESVIESEVSHKEKQILYILESRKMVLMDLLAGQEERLKHRK